jgi:hypothetical protein
LANYKPNKVFGGGEKHVSPLKNIFQTNGGNLLFFELCESLWPTRGLTWWDNGYPLRLLSWEFARNILEIMIGKTNKCRLRALKRIFCLKLAWPVCQSYDQRMREREKNLDFECVGRVRHEIALIWIFTVLRTMLNIKYFSLRIGPY